ncbi:MAG: PH domain-containing protein [Acidobacteriota bacterium]
MSDLNLRPSQRQAHALLILCLIPVGALLRYVFFSAPDTPKAWLLAGLFFFIFPLRLYAHSWSTRLTVEGGTLRLVEGLLSQNATSMALDRIQKISVHRTLWQRLWGIGDIEIESAAESGAIRLHDVDDPQAVADRILALSRSSQQAS